MLFSFTETGLLLGLRTWLLTCRAILSVVPSGPALWIRCSHLLFTTSEMWHQPTRLKWSIFSWGMDNTKASGSRHRMRTLRSSSTPAQWFHRYENRFKASDSNNRKVERTESGESMKAERKTQCGSEFRIADRLNCAPSLQGVSQAVIPPTEDFCQPIQ